MNNFSGPTVPSKKVPEGNGSRGQDIIAGTG